MTKPFWEYSAAVRPHEVAFYWAEVHMAQRALETGEVDYEYNMHGALKPGATIIEFIAEIETLGVRLFHRKISSPSDRDDFYFLINDETAVWVDITKKSGAIIFQAHTVVKENINFIKELAAKYITRTSAKGAVFAMTTGQNGGLQLRQFGLGGEDFIEGNYHPDAVKEYQHVVADLNDNAPCGRIVILDGPPGTGKTHMVRALLNEVPKGKFVLIQSSMITSLGAPEFLTALMREQRTGCPMIIILEDADEALSSRKADNISAISALLNFSDGIFGSIMDMRIIATTNIELKDLDKAVMRDGRLCRRIEIGQLGHEQAEKVFQRLAGKVSGGLFTKGNFYTLGTIYKMARGGDASGSFEVKKPKGRIGFSMEEDPKMEPWNGQPLTEGNALTGADLERAQEIARRFGDRTIIIKKEKDEEEDWEDDDELPPPASMGDDDDDDLIDEDPPEDD